MSVDVASDVEEVYRSDWGRIVAVPDALAPEAECAVAARVRSVEEARGARQVRCVAAVRPDDSVPDDCSVAPRADDHSARVALPDDYSAQADWAVNDYSAPAHSAQADCFGAGGLFAAGRLGCGGTAPGRSFAAGGLPGGSLGYYPALRW
jgi:hypothetical protein